MAKVFWFDTETTGLDPEKHAIVQIGGIIEIDGKNVEEFFYKCHCMNDRDIDPKAIQVMGIPESEIATWQAPIRMYRELRNLLQRYIDPFKKGKTSSDRFYPAGYNVRFDLGFLESFFKAMGDKYLWAFLSHSGIDVMEVMRYIRNKGLDFPDLEGCALGTVNDYLKIGDPKQHNAFADAKLTRDLSLYLDDRFFKVEKKWMQGDLLTEANDE